MAYSDYGGYAYLNGVRQVDRSDVVFNKKIVGSTPGQWPGFTMDSEASYHVLLGSGDVHIGLYKQTYLVVYIKGEAFDLDKHLMEQYPEAVDLYDFDGCTPFLNKDYFVNKDITIYFDLGKYQIAIKWIETDNYYQLVRLTQPDGNTWLGWSGYGVGAGLENCGYGFSTSDLEDICWGAFNGEV